MAVEKAMEPSVEILRLSQVLDGDLPHPSHDPHVEHHVEGVGQLDANLSQWGSWRSHQVGHHIERAPLHTAARQL